MNRNLVILLHGVGSNGDDLAGLGRLWRHSLPDTDFVSPNAPLPFEHGAGYQWFSIAGVTEGNRAARVVAARGDFDRTIGEIIAEHGLSEQLERVALVGFSQGSIMSLDALVSGRWPVGAVVAFSGRLASPAPYTPSLTTQVLLVHGEEDAVIPVVETRQAAAVLSEAGVALESHVLPNLGHTISQRGADLAAGFLARTLAPSART
ncbi:prolyl oligopeptidase family serine peptidase [Affinibrenneria salicis]|uniref:Prolyl oligopeptidase family serine peptidase n=1 Tax=Affinibrenneria salicis TaxID=2590031 RepID=A0A5J5FXX6_9GAMM|nr:dienelactone hydrolase family protein [Affinibrenneria salicis]KAA8998955.1 prolyl oligopeptidase family serine peptidase [Affinibrenneria salicis]